MFGLGRHYEVTARCTGEINPTAGYLLDIKEIDRAVRDAVVPLISQAAATLESAASADPFKLVREATLALAGHLRGNLFALRWHLDPFYSLECIMSEPSVVLLRQKFDFAAAHRLHVPSWSDEQNRQAFGKCNNARGHGHNYQVEPCVALRVTSAAPTFTLQHLEAVTDATVIQRFDHKHLNEDTREFATVGGLNPSVENIAKIFFGLLAPEIKKASPDAELRSITVWETDRTCATYPA